MMDKIYAYVLMKEDTPNALTSRVLHSSPLGYSGSTVQAPGGLSPDLLFFSRLPNNSASSPLDSLSDQCLEVGHQ
jgi:hypothetical protein